MLKDNNCKYCSASDELYSILIKIKDLETSTLFLFKDQAHKGRCVLAFRDHKTEIFQLDEKELASFSRDAWKAAKAIAEAFSPDKINYGVYGDLAPHFHVHLVPKYKGGVSWGRPFELNPEKPTLLSETEYKDVIDRILKALK